MAKKLKKASEPGVHPEALKQFLTVVQGTGPKEPNIPVDPEQGLKQHIWEIQELVKESIDKAQTPYQKDRLFAIYKLAVLLQHDLLQYIRTPKKES